MIDNDFFLDDEEYDDSSQIIGEDIESDGDETEEEEIAEDIQELEGQKSRAKRDAEIYGDKWTPAEIALSAFYDDMYKATKKKDGVLEMAVSIMIEADPKNTSSIVRQKLVGEKLQRQGHARIVNFYKPEVSLRGEDVDEELMEDDNSSFNAAYLQEAKDKIASFIEYLASRDLSQDSTISRRRKMRHIPAFIIFLFSTGMYDLIVNCETMPPEYASQIKNALEVIQKEKYSIVDELARRYEAEGRPKVAEKVREMGLSWFSKEPNEIRATPAYSDLGLTLDDVLIYKEYRGKFTNASKNITQDLISDLVEVVIDPEAMIYEKLKDKTRADAISDVKDVWKKWDKETSGNSELSTKVIWGDLTPPEKE